MKAVRAGLENVQIYSAHCFNEMQVIGVKTPAIHKAIFNQEHKWQIMLLTFCVGDDGVKYYDTVIPDIGVCNSVKAQEICDPISDEMIKKLHPRHFVCSGWFAVLTDKIDLLAMKEDIAKVFEDAGAYDRDVCNLAWSLRPESEK